MGAGQLCGRVQDSWLNDCRFKWASQWCRARAPALEGPLKRGHQMDGWLLCTRLCACPEISSVSNSVQTLQKSFRWDYKLGSPVCKCMRKDHIHMLRIQLSLSEFSGLWKQQHNPACTKVSEYSSCWSWILYKRSPTRKKIFSRVNFLCIWVSISPLCYHSSM